MATFKLQSAMEYLMTYGWAILIIAIVLVALLATGALGGLGVQTCTAGTGFECSSYSYTAATGNLILTVGQSTGTSWTTTTVYFVPLAEEGSVPTLPSQTASTEGTYDSYYAFNGLSSGMSSGVTQSVTIPIASSAKVGASLQGQLWVEYTTAAGGSSPIDAQFATINVKAS